MRDIKDYLHLYLGCETDQGLLVGMVNCDNEKEDIQCICLMKEGGLVNGSIKNIKPILRPLSDMMDEEMDNVWHSEEPKIVLEMNYTHGKRRKVALCSERTRFLLSRRFDLFNLIPEGLAIDKTTLKQTA